MAERLGSEHKVSERWEGGEKSIFCPKPNPKLFSTVS